MGSYEQLQAIIDLTPTFISYVGTDGRYRLVSKHYLNYFGRSLEQILGKEMREVIGEVAWQQVAPAMEQALSGQVAHFEAQFPVPGLGMRWSAGTYTPDIDADGTVQGVVIFVKDITDQKLYERALKEKDAFYHSIFESPGIFHIETDTQTGRLLRVSRSACELLGYTEAELLDGRTFLDLTHPDDRARNWSLVRPLVEGKVDHFRIEKRYLRKDGSVVWVEAGVTALRDSDGNVCRLLAAVQDISARVNAEQALRESEERVRLAVNAAGIGYWTMDPETQSCTMDEICAKLFDVAMTSTKADAVSRIAPEDQQRVLETFDDSLSRGDAYRAEFRVTKADGSQRWLMGLGAAVKDPSDGSSLIRGVNIDITAQKVAEEEREKFVSLARNSSEFIGICDLNGKVLFLNDAALAMSGYCDSNKAFEVQIWELFVEEDRGLIERGILERVLISGREELETRVQDIQTAQVRWIMLTISPVNDTRGLPVGLALVGRDVTFRKNAEEQLRELDRRKDEFLATLAHELRNPLASVSNALQVWPRLEHDPKRLSEIRAIMNRQVAHLKHLIDDLLDVSRISQGKIDLKRERLELPTILQQAVESIREKIDEAGHNLEISLPSEPIFVEGDRVRLTQVFANLIHNAVKYTNPGGELRATVEKQGDFVEIRIKDSGLGIPTDMLDRIFEPFTQVRDTHGRSQGGIGIGLALVRNLVRLHRGTISVHSEGIGKGSEFAVRLPRIMNVDTGTLDISSSQTAKSQPSAMRRLRVLVVDDQESLADTLGFLLEALGQETRVTYDGTSALEIAKGFHPDIVFSDLAMPGMDGFQLVDELRRTPGKRATVVAVTGYGQEQDRQRVRDAGFDFHLVKPTTEQAIREILMPEKVA